MYFESHAHYDDKRFNKDRHELLMKTHQSGVKYIVNAGADFKSSRKGVEMAAEYDFMYSAVGVHPHDAKEIDDNNFSEIEDLAKSPKVVAIGETGLDFHYDNSPRPIQRKWFVKQLELAKTMNLPVIIHSRDASEETFNIIREAELSDRNGKSKGVIHCYSGSANMAQEYIKMGYYIGIGGVVTYSKAIKCVEVVKTIPIEWILIETDCPYLSPVPNRGQRNDSQNLKYICQKISEIKQISAENVAEITMKNGKTLFDIK